MLLSKFGLTNTSLRSGNYRSLLVFLFLSRDALLEFDESPPREGAKSVQRLEKAGSNAKSNVSNIQSNERLCDTVLVVVKFYVLHND